MKKSFKKIVSMLLVVLLFGNMTFITYDITTYATDISNENAKALAESYYNRADNMDFDNYLATHFTSSPAIDLIYIGMENLTIAPGLISDLQNNLLFQTAYATWEVSTFIDNPGETIENILNRELYYETVLFRLLESSLSSDNAMDWLNQGAVKFSLDFGKILADSAELDYSYDVSYRSYISDLDESEIDYLNSLADNYVSGQGFKILGNTLDFVDKAISVSTSIEEFSARIGSYLQLANLSESSIAFLEKLKINSTNQLLANALETVLTVSNESFVDFMDVAAKEGAVTLGKTVLKNYIGSKWKNLLVAKLSSGILSSGFSIVNGALIANSLGQVINNVCFSTSKKLDHYELLKALVETEITIKSTVATLLNNNSSGTMLSTALDMLYDVYALDCDLCTDLVNIMDSDWIQLSTTAQRNQAKENINTVKSFYSTQYEKILPQKGTCGNTLCWLFDSMSGELIIFGVGKMNDYSKESAPWYKYKDVIRNIHISSLCSRIGAYAFYGLSNLSSTIIFTDIIKTDVVFRENCFSSINSDVSLIFTESVCVENSQIGTFIDSVYALKSLRFRNDGDGFSYGNFYNLRELHVGEQLSVARGNLSIQPGGLLDTATFSSYEACLIISEDATVNIYGWTEIIGRNHSSVVNVDHDALKIENGGSLNVYGNVRFCSGIFTANSDSTITITGNCLVGGGGISQATYLNNYGNICVDGKLTVKGGYCSASLFRVYGTVTMGDFYATTNSSSEVGRTYIYGSAFITDETLEHNLRYLIMSGDSPYLSVHGKASNINSYESGPVFGSGSDTCVCTIELYDDAYFSKAAGKNLRVIFSGNEKQTISGYDNSISAGIFEINNKKGVTFNDAVTSLVLFNHKQYPFTLKKTNNIFQDFDKDGLLDDVDPYPLKNNTDFDCALANDNTTITIIRYKGSDKDIIIPDTIAGLPVTYINSTFADGDFESITIGKNISSLSTLSFNSATKLQNIYVAEGNNTFSSIDGVLYNLSGTIVQKYPRGRTDNTYVMPSTVTGISSNAFAYSSLEHIRIPEGVTSLGLNSFSNCRNLKTVYYDAINCSKTAIFNFSPFSAAIENFIIGENVEHLPACLLVNANVTEITIPASVTEINSKAFYNFTDLTIKAYANSCAQQYAESNGYDFVAITCGSCECSNWQIKTDATCTQDGSKTGICDICGIDMAEIVSATGHADTKIINASESTCTEEGYTGDTYCTICNTVIANGNSIAKTAHNFTSKVTLPTCTADGFTTYTCSVCGNNKSDETSKLGHNMGSYNTVKAPTCTESGEEKTACSHCDYYKIRTIEATGHSDGDSDGTCDSCGTDLTQVSTCSCNCHKTGFMGFIYKIIRIFWKVFGTNNTCGCGVAHY